MKDVFRRTGFVLDARVFLADDADLPDAAFFVSLSRFRADRAALLSRGGDLGVVLDPADRLDDLVGDLASLGALAIRFPTFTDGRGSSLARLLRERHGWRGELRAVGEIRWDQLEALCRCGFDTIEVDHEPTRRRLERGDRPAMPVRYQPVGGDGFSPVHGRPWASAAWADAWCGA